MNEQEIEQVMAGKGLTAPYVNPSAVDAKIASAQYYVFPETTVTVCCLTLENGYAVTGTSACVSPENFDPELGRSIAFGKARDKIWALEGYLLREKLAAGPG